MIFAATRILFGPNVPHLGVNLYGVKGGEEFFSRHKNNRCDFYGVGGVWGGDLLINC